MEKRSEKRIRREEKKRSRREEERKQPSSSPRLFFFLLLMTYSDVMIRQDSLLAPGVAHPCAPLVHSIWAGLLSLLEAVAKSEKISTALCRTLKSVIRLLGTQFEPYLGKESLKRMTY